MRHRKAVKGTVLLALLMLLGATFTMSAANAQTFEPFTVGFPDEVRDSGRFINVTRGMSSLGDTPSSDETLNISLAIAPDLGAFKLLVFDGDMSTSGQWDRFGCGGDYDEITFKLFKDPTAAGSTDPNDLLWEWPASVMEDSTWCWLLPGNNGTDGIVQCEDPNVPDPTVYLDNLIYLDGKKDTDGNPVADAYNPTRDENIYHLVAMWDSNNCFSQQNNFKVAVQGTPYLKIGSTIGFQALDFWPNHPNNPGTPVLYDGTFSFLFNVPENTVQVTLWDGDTDLKKDTDDANTENNITVHPPFPTAAPTPPNPVTRAGTYAEGAHMGRPADKDVTYTVVTPLGQTVTNTNPSGTSEWERFVINGTDSDVSGVKLTEGYYQWNFRDLDLYNTVFIHSDYETTINNGAIGDYVWNDADKNGIQGDLELGIQGVTVNLYYFDTPTDNWVKLRDTVTNANGLYLFNINWAGDYKVEIDPANFTIKGKLFGLTPSPVDAGNPNDDTKDSDGDTDTHDAEVTMGVGETNRILDFGFYEAECLPCKGGVTELTLRYDGSVTDALVTVGKKIDKDVVFEGVVNPGEAFRFGDHGSGDKLSDIKIFINGDENAAIHTSCSQPVDPGTIFGDFTVVEGYSKQGLICTEKKYPCSVKSVESKLKGNKLEWKIENTSTGTVTIEEIDIQWPDGAGGLEKIKFSGDIFEPKNPELQNPLTINSNSDPSWDGKEKDRQLKKGKKKALKFEFEEDIPAGDIFVTVKFAEGEDCVLYLELTPTSGDFECDKPLDALTMIWNGEGFGYPKDILVTAWAGSVGDEPELATLKPVSNDQAITVSGYAAAKHPNDVIWEIFDTSGAKLGESVFHLSCSDDDMDGSEDCGNWEGNGKKNASDYLNYWNLEGMTDSQGTFTCTP